MSTTNVESAAPLTPERRRELTRSHLLAAAAQVFSQRGFHGASIDEIAAAAGFTKGAVYSNFKNKEDLFLALIDERTGPQFEHVRATLAEAAQLPPEDQTAMLTHLTEEVGWLDPTWQSLYLEFVVYAMRHPTAREKLAARERRAHELVVGIMEHELRRGGIEPPLPVDQIASLALALFLGIGLRRSIDPDAVDESLLEVATHVISQISGMDLGVEAGTKLGPRPGKRG
jgi:AcrR family transcriptional regulator